MEGKIEAVLRKVERLGADAYITFDWADSFYLSGFKSSFSVVLVSPKGCLFITDGRYLEEAERRVKELKVLKWEGLEKLFSLLKEMGIESLALDTSRIKASLFNEIKKRFETVEEDGFLKEFRSVKSEEEVAKIAKAAKIAETALLSVLHLLKPGVREREFRGELVKALLKFGSEDEAFPTIVASGENSSVPHHKTGGREIREGDCVIIDFGAVWDGYVCDITRTFFIGKVSSELKEIYSVVSRAKEIGEQKLRAGVSCKRVDEAVRDYISSKGYGEHFLHSLGHGIGIEVHEAPTLSVRSNEVLKRGNTITVEPGIYVPGLGGVRIEDDFLIKGEGSFRLTDLDLGGEV